MGGDDVVPDSRLLKAGTRVAGWCKVQPAFHVSWRNEFVLEPAAAAELVAPVAAPAAPAAGESDSDSGADGAEAADGADVAEVAASAPESAPGGVGVKRKRTSHRQRRRQKREAAAERRGIQRKEDLSDRICHLVASGQACPHGAECPHGHDVAAYLARRPPLSAVPGLRCLAFDASTSQRRRTARAWTTS
jgi:hypothetical protein